jgi:hypothetical protein
MPGIPPENRVWFTNVSPGQCIPLGFTVQVTYTNANLANGTVGVSCGGATASADQSAPVGTGSLSFALNHAAAVNGHTITASLKNNNVHVTGGSAGPVNIANPCPIVVGVGEMVGGMRVIGTAAELSGTYNSAVGDDVFLHVEVPIRVENGVVKQARLIYVDDAKTKVGKGGQPNGEWKHAPITLAQPGYHLLAILTKDGEVKSIVRSVFK